MIGAAEGKYDYEYRQKRRNDPSRFKLVLDDGRFWKKDEKIPDEIYNYIMIEKHKKPIRRVGWTIM